VLTKLFFLAFLLVLLQSRGPAATSGRDDETRDECVVLLHGLGRTPLSMKRIEWSLARADYSVVNVPYSSRRYSIEQLSEKQLPEILGKAAPGNYHKVHFVTHSLGGIILRQYLSNHSVANLGRVVMLAPPNQGSEIVDHLRHNAIGRWALGPGGCQLGTGPNDLPQRLGVVNFDLGVIAGDRTFNPWLASFLSGPNDGKVSVARARVQGMKDFEVVHNSHTWMMLRGLVLRQITAFLRNGHFEHAS